MGWLCSTARWRTAASVADCPAVAATFARLQPAVYQFATPLQHSGFEDFSVKFQWGELGVLPGLGAESCSLIRTEPSPAPCPPSRTADLYPAHMKVVGNNAFWLWGCANSWIRNVNIVDADTGAEAQVGRRCTSGCTLIGQFLHDDFSPLPRTRPAELRLHHHGRHLL